MIRMVEDHGGRKLIRSVQVTPFDAPDGASLVAIPDAYALTADGAKQPVTAEMRREYRTSLGIDILYRNLAMDKRDEAKGHVVDLIAGAWQGASKLASKLAEEI
jgi:hypothetical protein